MLYRMLKNAGGTGTIYKVFPVLIQGNLNPFKDHKKKKKIRRGVVDDVTKKKNYVFFFRVIVIEMKIGYRNILINVEKF